MGTTTIGILAHVDAGKTSLTERILFETGVIKTAGRVDHGTTQTDTLAQERARGITIKAAVASFDLGEQSFALIDTPGHADFIAEVERSLMVLDGVVLVISAVEGIQPQTRKLVRAIRAADLPVIVFINKIDRVGARGLSLLADIRTRLNLPVLPLSYPVEVGSAEVSVSDVFEPESDWTRYRIDLLAETSDALIEHALLDDGEPPDGLIERQIADQVSEGRVVPVLFGSATLGVGVGSLLGAIADSFMSTEACVDSERIDVNHGTGPRGDRATVEENGRAALTPETGPRGDRATSGDAAVSARVFKVQQGPNGERLVLVRVIAGTLAVRDKIGIAGSEADPERVTGMDRFVGGGRLSISSADAGEIVCLHGLKTARIGDVLGAAMDGVGPGVSIATPALESVVSPVDPAKRQALHVALEQMADGDPFIAPRLNPRTGEISIRLFGEVQTDVVGESLRSEFGVPVTFGEPRPICIERVTGTGSAVEIIGTPENPFYGTVGITVSRGPVGSGIDYRWNPGSLPPAYYRVIEETTLHWLHEGLCGWEVTDAVVTLDQVGYWSPVTTGTDFRKLTPLVLFAALDAAGTTVCEPINRYEIEGPAEALTDILRVLGGARLIPEETRHLGAMVLVMGSVAVMEMRAIEQRVLGLGHGEVSFSSEFLEYRPVVGEPPVRARTDVDPRNRAEYLAGVAQR